MDKKEQILHYYRVDGLSLREISRRVGLNRKTVTRYVRELFKRMQVYPAAQRRKDKKAQGSFYQAIL